ncbi:MAG: DinB family protein [Candidatus Solibacter sp.]
MTDLHVSKPPTAEYASYFGRYVDLVPEGEIAGTLASQMERTLNTLRQVSDEDSLKRYAAGKWSIREVVGHMIDAERIFAYRLLRFARNDQTPLSGFEQDDYIPAAQFDRRSWADLLEEFDVVRRSTLLMLRGLHEEAWQRMGVSNNHAMSVRAAAYVIAGHERHHMNVLRDKYAV